MIPFPISKKDQSRIDTYKTNELIFLGEHFDAFRMLNKDFYKDFPTLEYVTINLGGMLSRLSADFLFEEPPQIKLSKENTEWWQSVYNDNKLDVQLYESGLETSYRGDAVFRIRAENGKCIIEDINPETYFAVYDPKNIRKEPTEHVIATEVVIPAIKDKCYLLERHQKGKIINELITIENGLPKTLDIVSYYPEIKPEELTNISDFLVFHVKNYGINSQYYGISDYKDLISLMYAVNNRLTRTDNIINKHGDPILAVPKGVIDEDGKVRRGSFGMIEVDVTEKGAGVPQYIVWDAKLESAMQEIDKLMDMFYMLSETSQSAFGVDKDGVAESGRALKFKLLRTLAKKHRKQLYYDYAIKGIVKVAHEFSIANNLSVNGIKPKGKAEVPTIVWNDGIINDAKETIEIEEQKLNNKLTTRADAISNIEGIDQDDAMQKVKMIDEEAKSQAPKFAMNPINPKDPINE